MELRKMWNSNGVEEHKNDCFNAIKADYNPKKKLLLVAFNSFHMGTNLLYAFEHVKCV